MGLYCGGVDLDSAFHRRNGLAGLLGAIETGETMRTLKPLAAYTIGVATGVGLTVAFLQGLRNHVLAEMARAMEASEEE